MPALIKYTICALALGMASVKIDAQISCGTLVNSDQKAFEATIPENITEIKELNQVINISVFRVQNSSGLTEIEISEINKAFDYLNEAFDRIKLSFIISSNIKIENYHFNAIVQNKNESDLVTQFRKTNQINLYLVSELRDYEGSQVMAYTYFPSSNKDVVFIQKNFLNGPVLTEQIAHLFNLYHTHETAFGKEFANLSNCSEAGDLVCDTPADPNLINKMNSADQPCSYTGSDKDPQGDFYTPTVNNYLSATKDECKCFFSERQYIRMLNCIETYKSYLW